MDPTLDQIKTTFFSLDDNFDTLYAQCTTDDQRSHLRDLESSAEDAYWKAVADGLVDNNTVVQKFTVQLQDANNQIKTSLENLKDIAAFLNLATEAVKLAAAITTLAASA